MKMTFAIRTTTLILGCALAMSGCIIEPNPSPYSEDEAPNWGLASEADNDYDPLCPGGKQNSGECNPDPASDLDDWDSEEPSGGDDGTPNGCKPSCDGKALGANNGCGGICDPSATQEQEWNEVPTLDSPEYTHDEECDGWDCEIPEWSE